MSLDHSASRGRTNPEEEQQDPDSEKEHRKRSLESPPRKDSKRSRKRSRRRRTKKEHEPSRRSSRRRRRSRENEQDEEKPRRGIVSDDEEEEGNSLSENKLQEEKACRSSKSFNQSRHRRRAKKSKSPSYHDDTVGHFRGGPGTVLQDAYQVVAQVGVGTFGRVLECIKLSRRSRREEYVAIKIVRNVKRYYDSAALEASMIRDINRRGGRGRSHVVVLHDTFSFQGHFCMVFESLGPSLYDFLKRHDYQPFPIICVQDFAVQLLETLEFLHSFRCIHTDLKIENILLMNDREVNYLSYRVPESTKIKVIDFGGACYDDDKKSSVINTRQYRAPEVILDTGWSMPADMWSAGCVLAELYLGDLLFATHDNCEHLALMEAMIGYFPRRMIKAAQKNKNSSLVKESFDKRFLHRRGRVLSAEHTDFVERTPELERLIRDEHYWFLDLLRMILVIDPCERATAHESLRYLRRVHRDEVRCA